MHLLDKKMIFRPLIASLHIVIEIEEIKMIDEWFDQKKNLFYKYLKICKYPKIIIILDKFLNK